MHLQMYGFIDSRWRAETPSVRRWSLCPNSIWSRPMHGLPNSNPLVWPRQASPCRALSSHIVWPQHARKPRHVWGRGPRKGKKSHYCDMANILSEQTKFTTDECFFLTYLYREPNCLHKHYFFKIHIKIIAPALKEYTSKQLFRTWCGCGAIRQSQWCIDDGLYPH